MTKNRPPAVCVARPVRAGSQPHTNYRALESAKSLFTRMAQKIVKRWADYSRLGDFSPTTYAEMQNRRAGLPERRVMKVVLSKYSFQPQGIKAGR